MKKKIPLIIGSKIANKAYRALIKFGQASYSFKEKIKKNSSVHSISIVKNKVHDQRQKIK